MRLLRFGEKQGRWGGQVKVCCWTLLPSASSHTACGKEQLSQHYHQVSTTRNSPTASDHMKIWNNVVCAGKYELWSGIINESALSSMSAVHPAYMESGLDWCVLCLYFWQICFHIALFFRPEYNMWGWLSFQLHRRSWCIVGELWHVNSNCHAVLVLLKIPLLLKNSNATTLYVQCNAPALK